MFGKYYISKHALERYEQRTNESKQSVQKRILRDLNALRNKKIIHIGPNKKILSKRKDFILFFHYSLRRFIY